MKNTQCQRCLKESEYLLTSKHERITDHCPNCFNVMRFVQTLWFWFQMIIILGFVWFFKERL